MVQAKTELDYLQSQIASVARKTGISSVTKLALIAPSAQGEEVPEIEWWDAAILPNKRWILYDIVIWGCAINPGVNGLYTIILDDAIVILSGGIFPAMVDLCSI